MAHTEADGTLSPSRPRALGAALGAGRAQLTVGLGRAPTCRPAAEQIAGCGAARFLAVSGDAFAQPRYATDAAAAEALCRAAGATLVIAPATSRWARALPGVAYRLGGRIDTHATESGRRTALPRSPAGTTASAWKRVLTRERKALDRAARSGLPRAWSGAAGYGRRRSGRRRPLPATAHHGDRRPAPQADEQTIRPDAKLLFVAGAGWTKKQADGAVHADEAEKLILGFLRDAGLARRQQVAGGPERRRPGGAARS